MQINIGTTERAVRLVLGTLLVILPFVTDLSAPWNWVAAIAGAVLVMTGALRFCPAYSLFGLRGRGRK